MAVTKYKYNRYIQPEFPIYYSVQSGRENLVINHYHSSAEIILVLKGRVKILLGSNYCECSEGDIVFIPPMMVHEVNSLTEDAAIKGIPFELSLVHIEDLELDFQEMFRRSRYTLFIINKEDPEQPVMVEYINSIAEIYGNFSAKSKLKIVSVLLMMFSVLLEKFSLEESIHDKNDRKLRDVLTYVEEHYKEKISISELSEIIHVCDDRLIRMFKEATGATPMEYIINLRIETSIKLLASTDLSIAEVAEQSGFGSHTYMARVFKQKLNSTPGKFRRK